MATEAQSTNWWYLFQIWYFQMRQLIFSIASGVMLCFGWKTMLITYWCFQLLLSSVVQSQGYFSILCFCQQGGLAKHKDPGGDRPRTADLNWPKGYSTPYDIKNGNYKIERSCLGELARGDCHYRSAIACVSLDIYVYISTMVIIIYMCKIIIINVISLFLFCLGK